MSSNQKFYSSVRCNIDRMSLKKCSSWHHRSPKWAGNLQVYWYTVTVRWSVKMRKTVFFPSKGHRLYPLLFVVVINFASAILYFDYKPTLAAAGSANEQCGLPPWYQAPDFSNMASTDPTHSQQSTFASNLTIKTRIMAHTSKLWRKHLLELG